MPQYLYITDAMKGAAASLGHRNMKSSMRERIAHMLHGEGLPSDVSCLVDGVDPAGVEQDALRQRGLAAVYVRRDANVSEVLERCYICGAVLWFVGRLRLSCKASGLATTGAAAKECCTWAGGQAAVTAQGARCHAQSCCDATRSICNDAA